MPTAKSNALAIGVVQNMAGFAVRVSSRHPPSCLRIGTTADNWPPSWDGRTIRPAWRFTVVVWAGSRAAATRAKYYATISAGTPGAVVSPAFSQITSSQRSRTTDVSCEASTIEQPEALNCVIRSRHLR
jgi:hypothetical protein